MCKYFMKSGVIFKADIIKDEKLDSCKNLKNCCFLLIECMSSASTLRIHANTAIAKWLFAIYALDVWGIDEVDIFFTPSELF